MYIGGAKIGKNCVIFQQVTIGSNTLKSAKGNGAPIIGDNVYIGAGSKIIGNISVGNNCRIGANTVVIHDVPANSTVVMGEARVIPHDYELDNRFFNVNSRGKQQYYDDGNWIECDE